MHRGRLLQLLASYAAVDSADDACRQRFEAFVANQPRCFERELEIGHVTGAAWIVDRTGTRVLLTHHRKLDLWLQPGGHCDGDPDVEAVALKEAREETGLDGLVRVQEGIGSVFDLDIHRIPGRGVFPEHEHFDVRFAFRATAGDAFVVSDESHALAWVPLAELERFTQDPSILRMRTKWRASSIP